MILKHLGVPLASITLTREGARKMFMREGERLLYIAQDIDDYLLTQRVQVKRTRGMVEASCHWSMDMLIEHAITVGSGIRSTLRKLRSSSIPKPDGRIVQSKPLGNWGPPIRKNLQDFLTQFAREFDQVSFRKENSTTHPWFGRMNALQWYRLAALNKLVHRLHAERIYERLPHTNICE